MPQADLSLASRVRGPSIGAAAHSASQACLRCTSQAPRHVLVAAPIRFDGTRRLVYLGCCSSATGMAQHRHDALHGAAGAVHNTDGARGGACAAMPACFRNRAFRPRAPRCSPSRVHRFGDCGLCVLPVVTANEDGPSRDAPGQFATQPESYADLAATAYPRRVPSCPRARVMPV